MWFQVVWQGSSHSVCDHRSKGVVSHFGGVRGVGPPLERVYRLCSLVEVINRGRAKELLMCHQLRSLFFISAFPDFEVTVRHTPGRANGAADALSRDDLDSFRTQVPYTGSGGAPLRNGSPGVSQVGPRQSASILENARLDRLVLQVFESAVSPATLRTYRSAQSRYLHFCSTMNIDPSISCM